MELDDRINEMSAYKRFTKYWWRDKWDTLTSLHLIAWYKWKLLRDYGPVIWRQGECDQSYLYELLLVKFKRMRRRAENHSMIADWGRQARDYMIAENLLTRLLNDEYGDPEYVTSNEDGSEKAWKKRRRQFKHEEYLRQQDIDTLCRLIRRRVQVWWD